MTDLLQFITNHVNNALQEDLGDGDITVLLIPPEQQLELQLISRQHAILCGQQWFDEAFLQLDPGANIDWQVNDGDAVGPDQVLCKLAGNARAMLSAERTALNFLQTLSATASVTHYYQSLINHTACRILDTRKTIPNLRLAQKYAVRCGGGHNHRIGLFDAFLLKENHLAAAGDMASAVNQARHIKPDALLEVEVETLDQLRQAIDAKVDRVLLDNFSLEQLEQAVRINQGQVELEASGNITEQTIRQVAQTGVDYISIGALTKHIQAIDFSLRYID
ncbi:MAG: carboxylating nicotinate-nucleotide diphosphorylase [Gammaproteobacteria bacterium]|nr:carboxylating nicotinate-nucleotide diphosphorylase [Gammaproteobacteria bacterium]